MNYGTLNLDFHLLSVKINRKVFSKQEHKKLHSSTLPISALDSKNFAFSQAFYLKRWQRNFPGSPPFAFNLFLRYLVSFCMSFALRGVIFQARFRVSLIFMGQFFTSWVGRTTEQTQMFSLICPKTSVRNKPVFQSVF